MSINKKFGISDSLIEAVKSVLEAPCDKKMRKEKLDPVGKADADIDNDGDVDDSDEYLQKRRKAISKAAKKDKELDEEQKLFMFKTKAEAEKKAKEVNGKVVALTKQNFAVVTEEVDLDEAKAPVTKDAVAKLLIKYGNNPQQVKKMIDKEFDSAVKRHPTATASKIADVISAVSEEVELDESDFDKGDKVVCKASDMEGVVAKVDPSEKGKYYTVKREDGKMVKYAPDELELAEAKEKHSKNSKEEIDVEPSLDTKAEMYKSKKKKMMEKETPDGVDKGAVDPHNCATHVYHEEFGKGQPVFSKHAEPDEIGLIEWYDVFFEHGIEKRVPTSEMKILATEMHGSHKKKK